MLTIKTTVNTEIIAVRDLLVRYKEAQETNSEIKYDDVMAYLETLHNIANALSKVVVDTTIQIEFEKNGTEKI